MKVNLSRTIKDGHGSIMLLPILNIDFSHNYHSVAFGWLAWIVIIYSAKGGQP